MDKCNYADKYKANHRPRCGCIACREKYIDALEEKIYARLIAADPDLLEALEELLAVHDEDIGMDDHDDNDSVGWESGLDGTQHEMPLTFGVLRRARAAIAKARGETAYGTLDPEEIARMRDE